MDIELDGDLYLGGYPLLSELVHLLDDDSQSFGGCMRMFRFNDVTLDLVDDVRDARLVDLDGCPSSDHDDVIIEQEDDVIVESSVESSVSYSGMESVTTAATVVARNESFVCGEYPVVKVYEGGEKSFVDDVGSMFTRMLYKVFVVLLN